MLNHKVALLGIVVILGLELSTSVRAQSTPGPGSLVINEIMYNPYGANEPAEEWFEVKNMTGSSLDIGGCMISSKNDTPHTIAAGTVIGPRAFFVFGRSRNIPGVSVDYSYGTSGNIRLNNSDDTITITCGSTTIDTVNYQVGSPWPSRIDGTSIAFGLPNGGGIPESENDKASNWRHSTSTCCGGNGKGTPGAKNDDVLGPTAITLSTFSARSTNGAEARTPVASTRQWLALGVTIASAGVIAVIRHWRR